MALTDADCLALLKTFCNGNISDSDYRREIIYAFVNSVFVYDDKIVIYYNIGEMADGKPLTLEESNAIIAAAASDVSSASTDVSTAPPPNGEVPDNANNTKTRSPCSDSALSGWGSWIRTNE